jgi:hypothetical protein
MQSLLKAISNPNSDVDVEAAQDDEGQEGSDADDQEVGPHGNVDGMLYSI